MRKSKVRLEARGSPAPRDGFDTPAVKGRRGPPQRAAAHLLDDEGAEILAGSRKRFNHELGERDHVEVLIWTSDPSEELLSQPGELYRRLVIGPTGTTERVLEAVDCLCAQFDPDGTSRFVGDDAQVPDLAEPVDCQYPSKRKVDALYDTACVQIIIDESDGSGQRTALALPVAVASEEDVQRLRQKLAMLVAGEISDFSAAIRREALALGNGNGHNKGGPTARGTQRPSRSRQNGTSVTAGRGARKGPG